MDLVDLASNGASPSTMPVYAIVGTAVVLGLPVGLLIIWFVAWVRLRRAARFKGPALTGTAQLLSLAPASALAAFAFVTTYRRWVYWIGLRVEIPGRPPYDVTVTTPVPTTWLYNVQPGWTYAVQVDSANPENVRFDYRQSVGAPPGWYPDPSGQPVQRYFDGRQWTEHRYPPAPPSH